MCLLIDRRVTDPRSGTNRARRRVRDDLSRMSMTPHPMARMVCLCRRDEIGGVIQMKVLEEGFIACHVICTATVWDGCSG